MGFFKAKNLPSLLLRVVQGVHSKGGLAILAPPWGRLGLLIGATRRLVSNAASNWAATYFVAPTT